MNKEDLNSIKIILKEELIPIKNDLFEIKQNQRQLSKDISVSLGQYHDRLEKYVVGRTEALNKRVYNLESDMEQIIRK